MKNRTQKLVLGIVKTLGITVCVLIAITLIVVSALLYYEKHDFSDQNGLDKKEFSCCRGDLEIRGTMFMPSGQTDVPIAIVCHEFMTNRLFSYPYAMALARNGYAAFCFDFCGGGIVCGSDGDSRDMSVLTEIEDLKSVIAFAKEMRSGPMRIGKQYATDVMDIDTLPTITHYEGKVLILHGNRDTLVNISGSQKAAEAYEAAGTDVRFQIISGGKHIFRSPKHIKQCILPSQYSNPEPRRRLRVYPLGQQHQTVSFQTQPLPGLC